MAAATRSVLSAFLGLVLAGALLPSAAQEPGGDQATMQGSVKFVFGNDVWQPRRQFKSDNDWLALACDAKGCLLEPASLSVKQESWQGHYDDKPTSGQLLSFRRSGGSGKPVVAWLRAAPGPEWLKPGNVVTYYSPQYPLKQPTGRGSLEVIVDLPSGESALLVPMLRLPPPGSRDEGRSYQLQLRAQGRRQMLLEKLGICTETFYPRRYLQWAGDLDRDGKPDFLVSFIDQDGPVHLYLSSAAKTGQVVGLAGAYISPPWGGECDGAGAWE